MGKRSTHRLKRSSLKSWVGHILSFVLGSLLTFWGYTYLVREKPDAPKPFSQEVSLVDEIIKSQLYEIGVTKKDILLHQTSSKKEGKIAWEQSVIRIQLPGPLPFPQVEEELKRSLSLVGKPVSVTPSQDSESFHLEVKLLDRVTHRLTFIPPKPSVSRMGHRPRIAIVIDDLGGENQISKELLHWDSPVTFSILPFTPYSKTLAQEAHKMGKEVILHLPMEPHGYPKIKPGEGVLLYEMGEEKLLRQLSKDIEAVPYIKGVSNHMGSRLMEDPEKMKVILAELKKRGLFFLDSRTTPQTVGLQTAKPLGLKAMERTVFIDHSQEEKDIKQKLDRLIQLSFSTGTAIGIGHPHPATIKYLKEMIPRIREKGIEIVPLSTLME